MIAATLIMTDTLACVQLDGSIPSTPSHDTYWRRSPAVLPAAFSASLMLW